MNITKSIPPQLPPYIVHFPQIPHITHHMVLYITPHPTTQHVASMSAVDNKKVNLDKNILVDMSAAKKIDADKVMEMSTPKFCMHQQGIY